MYIQIVIQLSDGQQKIIEAKNYGEFLLLPLKLRKYAKPENKLVKVICDNFQLLGILKKELENANIHYGFKDEEGKLCEIT